MYRCLCWFAKIHAISTEEIGSMKTADSVFCALLHCFWIDTLLLSEISETHMSKPGNIKPKLSTWIFNTRGK